MAEPHRIAPMLFLAVSGVPLVLAWWLAGPEARRDLAGIDLLLAGAAGGAIGMFAAAVPGLLYAVGVSYGVLPDPPYVLLSDHSEWALAGLLMLAALVCAWLGYVAGLAYVLLEIGRRRAAGIVLITPLVVYALITGLYAMLLRLGITWARDFAGPSIFVLPAILPAAAGLWLLIRHRREEAGGYGAPATGPHQGGGTQD